MAPGIESQFDWKGPVKGLIAGAPERAVHFFRFVLAWSRARWTLVVPDLKLPATLASLNWAFGRAGGVTQRLVLDNPKTCVTRPKPHLELHPQFLAVSPPPIASASSTPRCGPTRPSPSCSWSTRSATCPCRGPRPTTCSR